LAVWEEADRRDYSFNEKKMKNIDMKPLFIPVTNSQIQYKWKHLNKKLCSRDLKKIQSFSKVK